jgi:hypothetical protein
LYNSYQKKESVKTDETEDILVGDSTVYCSLFNTKRVGYTITTREVLLKTVWNITWKHSMEDLKRGIRYIIVRQCIAHSNTTKTGTASMFLHGTIMP